MTPPPDLPPLPPDRTSPLPALLPASPGAPERCRQPDEATGEREVLTPDMVIPAGYMILSWGRLVQPIDGMP